MNEKRHRESESSSFNDWFRKFAHTTAGLVGSSWAFVIATVVIVVWAVTGPLFHFSDTWQLVINTSTTIVTFLMVFLIQNTQNRDAKAFHLKLDELLRGVEGARTELVDLEDMTEEELEQLEQEFKHLRQAHGKQDSIASRVLERAETVVEAKARKRRERRESKKTGKKD